MSDATDPVKNETAVILGGGAAGIFAAIACAERSPNARVIVLEKSPDLLAKVHISGGGRCNVCPACFEPKELVGCYPRGGKALLGAFHKFQPRDTVEWFEKRGVPIKAEPDGRMFPASNNSQSIVHALLDAAKNVGVDIRTHQGHPLIETIENGFFKVQPQGASAIVASALLVATGGCRAGERDHPAVLLGHSLEPPVPSLFSMNLSDKWAKELAGVSVPDVALHMPSTRWSQGGALLFTHAGISGPAVLRLSAWGARDFSNMGYQFKIHADFLPRKNSDDIVRWFDRNRRENGAKSVESTPFNGLPLRLWKALVSCAGLAVETRWAMTRKEDAASLLAWMKSAPLNVSGKNANKDEFVTCGGVNLKEVDFRTMESRICPGLYFAGEVLDVDGITGGYNFQAAWTTGWLAGAAMSRQLSAQ